MTIKEELIQECRDRIQKKIRSLKDAMDDLKNDLENESKSSAGDKYETGREMINIEWNKLSQQIVEFGKQVKILNRIEHMEDSESVQLGSLVDTGKAKYFISVPVGELYLNEERFYAIGVQSPIGKAMIGKKKGETGSFNQNEIKIISID